MKGESRNSVNLYMDRFDKKINSMSIKELKQLLEEVVKEENEIKQQLDEKFKELT